MALVLVAAKTVLLIAFAFALFASFAFALDVNLLNAAPPDRCMGGSIPACFFFII